MSTFLTSGVWNTPSGLLPGESDYMIIDVVRHRIIFFIALPLEPSNRTFLLYWYEQGKDSSIYVSFKQPAQWKTHFYRIDDSIIYWDYADYQIPWTLLAESKYPVWLEERLLDVHERMNLKEFGIKLNIDR